uniref:DUF4326 domain-containing protein n=1 Tax=Pithovirus LCPAC304 TaxID=2506594 RepID=A0A481Z960_9VIRU|nr:MAG: protein of unknown function DUF4326 [Pithovirus LCPAC304]
MEISITEVISLKGTQKKYGTSLELPAAQDIVYIGRHCYMGGWRLRGSPFANPFKTGRKTSQYPKGMTQFDVVREYKLYIASKPELLVLLQELKGKKLACWCKPNFCHGDVLKELLDM